jgi:hypothetical protein
MTKMKYTISFESDKSDEKMKPISVEFDIPSVNDFDNFVKTFDDLERAVLKGRKEVTEKAIEMYMSEISKKKQKI